MKKARFLFMKSTDTMKMLGYQYVSALFEREEIENQYLEVFDEIEKRNKLMDKFECTYLFILGYIWGKRDERSRKKHNTVK